MERITHYKVVYSNNVNEYLNEGWELYGPPLVIQDSSNHAMIFQAVIKREEKNDR